MHFIGTTLQGGIEGKIDRSAGHCFALLRDSGMVGGDCVRRLATTGNALLAIVPPESVDAGPGEV